MLDTSVAIFLRDGDERVEEELGRRAGGSFLSIISRVELEGGVYKDPAEAISRRLRLDQMLAGFQILPFGYSEAQAYGAIVRDCGFSRPRILDRMIAATAIVGGATLATMNPRDFQDIPDLRFEDWSRPQE